MIKLMVKENILSIYYEYNIKQYEYVEDICPTRGGNGEAVLCSTVAAVTLLCLMFFSGVNIAGFM